MKVAFKSLIAAAAFIAAGAASAAVVTVNAGTTTYKGVKLSGTETLSLSADFISLFDAFQTGVTSNGVSTTITTKDSDGIYISAVATAPIASLTVDDTNNQILSVTSPDGLTLTQPLLRNVSTGGSLTISNLSVDLLTKRVYATIVGANGVGTLTDYYLWDFDSVSGATTVPQPATSTSPGTNTITVTGLRLTADSLNKTVTSLGMVRIGSTALGSVFDFGSITLPVTATPVLTPCTVTIKTTAKNAAVFTTDVTIHNGTTNASTGWNVNWTYGVPTLLTNIQNAKITNKSLKAYTAQPGKTNATVAAGGATTFSFRGHANGGGIPAISDLSATLGGQSCPVTAQ
jgi:hypothetical protein